MKLTLEQALQKGIEARKNGQIQKANKHFTDILGVQPRHAHANHNMGLLAESAGNAKAALVFFKTALESHPKNNQFWLRYIGALIKLDHINDAQDALSQAQNNGIKSVGVDRLEHIISDIQANKEKPQDPPLNQQRDIISAYTKGHLQHALTDATSALKAYPHSVILCNIAGAACAGLLQFDRAIDYYQIAIKLNPKFVEAHYNMASALQKKGDLKGAIKAYKQAVLIKPDYADAFYNLANTLKDMGELGAAIKSYKQAIKINPDLHNAHNNMGNALKDMGKLTAAIESYKRAIKINSSHEDAYRNLGKSLQNVVFTRPDSDLKSIIHSMLESANQARPKDIAAAALSLLKLEPAVKEFLSTHVSGEDLQLLERLIANVDEEPLFLKLMTLCPLGDLAFEKILTNARSVLLMSANNISAAPATLCFLSALALQCFANDYLYHQTDEETKSLTILETLVEQALLKGIQPSPHWVLILGSYKALHQYQWCGQLSLTQDLQAVLAMQVFEPQQEHYLKTKIPILKELSDKVSSKVRDQYEESPYPKWIDLGLILSPAPIAKVVKALKVRLADHKIFEVEAPAILIAGCGTGQHSIDTAARFKNAKVLAIDLSLSSLAYAQRKTEAFGVQNLEYMQADLLDLGQLNKTFDIIESSGVLHHMEKPMAGWKVLVSCLKVGGLMKIGLYSELARQHIVKMREEIQQLNTETDHIGMKRFRNGVIRSKSPHHQLIISSPDFHSMGSLQDLLFHVQEHRFTIPQIQHCLTKLGLKFCGFEVGTITQDFKRTNSGEDDAYDLIKWHTYEQAHPHAFAGMYQFWCQKVG
ncbi:MAG: tetratricopeptide repeat protein [Oceanospirillaceae bacterium]|nr:tetratricopeptide repeat protein [Oceanospirillaceae bacterium]